MDVTDVVDDTARVGASVHEALRTADFAELTPAEARDAAAMLAALRPRLPLRPSRRRRPGRRGNRLAARLMLRSSLGAGGEPVAWRWWQRRTRPRPIALVCDVSGSMERYSRFLLRFAHALAGSGAPVEVFVFGTRLTRITRELRVRDPDAALDRVAGKVVDWSGGTRIGASLHELNRRWVRRTIRSSAVVIIVSDGWERDDPAQLAREVAMQVIRTGDPQLRSYCSSADEIAAWDLGVGCEGQVDVLVEPAGPRARERALLDERRPFVACGVMPGKGEGLGKGGRLIVTGDGSEGDLGSADLNRKATARARELLETGESGIHEISGRSIFFDVLVPPPQLVILGAGDDARPLVRFAADVGFRVVVVDRRAGYLTRERFPSAAALVESAGDELEAVLPLDAECYAVVMNHNFADDQAYVRALMKTPVAYVGMLGPRQRTERILRNLAAEEPMDEARVYGPVGLDIGTDGAEQVALAVIAEILAVRSGRRARSLRERRAAIHAPTD